MSATPSATPNNRDLGFVLKAIPYRERDLILSILTESRGRLNAIARNGVQSKRFGGALALFTAANLDLDEKTIRLSDANLAIGDHDGRLVQLNHAETKHTFPTLPKSFEKLSAASALNELLLRAVPPHKSVPEVFKLYSNSLTAIDEQADSHALGIVNAFILKLSQWLGVQPSLTRCLKCEKPLNEIADEDVVPRFETGGWLCLNCAQNAPGGSGRARLKKIVILDAFQSLLQPIRKIEWSAPAELHLQLLEYLEMHLVFFVPGLDRHPFNSFRILKSIQWPV